MSDINKSGVLGIEHGALDAEHAVLAAILYDGYEYKQLSGMLFAKHFSKSSHQVIFSCLQPLMQSDQVGISKLKEHLLQNGQWEDCGGDEFFKQLEESTQHSINIKETANLIRSYYALRECLSAYNEMASEVESGCDAIKLLDKVDKRIHRLIEEIPSGSPAERFSDVMSRAYNTLQDNYKRAESITGVSTGYKDIDDITDGLRRGDLIVVGAHPSVGKTSWLINLANNTAIHGKGSNVAAFFTFEMSRDDLGMRMLAVESRVDMHHMYSGQLSADDWRQLATASGLLADASIYVDDSCSSVFEILAKCQQIKSESKGLDLVLVDCLQVIGDKVCVDNRDRHLVDVTRSLKLLARELNVPVVVSSQLNSEVENRVDKRPLMSDLHEALRPEKYADMVMFIYRDDMCHGNTSNEGKAEIIIARNRCGPIGSIELDFFHKCGRFEGLVDELDEQFIYEHHCSSEVGQ